MDENGSALHVPAREIPVPVSVSPQAQAVLAIGALFEADPYPALDDFEGWRRRVADRDASMLMMIGARASNVEADTQELDVDGVRVYVITPDGIADDDPRVFLEIHGGGLIQGGGECCRVMALRAMGWSQVPTWAVDYRMPPDHPYPTPLDDCLAVYRAILRDHRPEEVIVGGGSAGGNLAAAMMLRARDEGLPLPAAAVLLTPEVDLTESGDSFQTNLGLDNVLTESLMPANLLYAAGHDLTDPYVSPLFGDFTKGFPPTILASGTRDLFLSNTVRMHRALRAAGVDADLHIIEAGGHGGFFGQAPEDEHLAKEIRRFIDARWPRERLNDAPYAFE